MASIGILGSPTYAVELSGIEEMLTVLPDNTANEINAQKVRNVVYTLYEEIQGNSASQFFYTNPNPLNNPIGNWTTGRTFSNVSLQDLFNGMFYKDVAASAGLEFVPTQTTLDFKPTTTSGYDETVSFKLKWTATKGTYNLISSSGRIDRDPSPIVPGEISQAGDPLFSINVTTQGGTDTTTTIKPRINVTNTYTFAFKDINNNPFSKSISIGYGVRYYWGRKSNNSPVTSSSEITSLSGAGVNGSGGFATTYRGNFDGINGAGQFLCFAYPSSFGGTPSFIINGLTVNAYTKVNSGFAFTNQFGYQIPYDVWVSNTAQNSPITKFQIT